MGLSFTRIFWLISVWISIQHRALAADLDLSNCNSTLGRLAQQLNSQNWAARSSDAVIYGPRSYFGYRDLWQGDQSIRLKMPPHTHKLLGKFPECDGVNCYSTTRYYFESEAAHKYFGTAEMFDWLFDRSSPLSEKEILKFGDIIAFWESEEGFQDWHSLVHTAVYVGGDWVFHKTNFSMNSPFVFERLSHLPLRFGTMALTSHRLKD